MNKFIGKDVADRQEARIAELEAELAALREANEKLRYYAAVGYGLEEEMYRHHEIGLQHGNDLRIHLCGFKFKGMLGVGEDMRQAMTSAHIWPDDAALLAAGLIDNEEKQNA